MGLSLMIPDAAKGGGPQL